MAWLVSLRARILASPKIAPDLYWPALDAQLLGCRLLDHPEKQDSIVAAAVSSAALAGLPGRPAE